MGLMPSTQDILSRGKESSLGAVPLLSFKTYPQSVHSLPPPGPGHHYPLLSQTYIHSCPPTPASCPNPVAVIHYSHGNQWNILKTNHVRSCNSPSQTLPRASLPLGVKSKHLPLACRPETIWSCLFLLPHLKPLFHSCPRGSWNPAQFVPDFRPLHLLPALPGAPFPQILL